MAQILHIHHKGLYTAPNEFSEVPDGALLLANHCVITSAGIIEPRRGNDRIASTGNASDRHNRFEWFQDQQMVNYSGGQVGYVSGSNIVALTGTYNHVDANLGRLRFLPTNSNLYFTASTGVYRLDAYNGTPTLSGVPKGLDLALTLTGATGFVDGGNQVAYRILWGIRDANSTLYLGAPSGRAVIINSLAVGNLRNVSVTFTIPSGITTSHFYQVYRSKASGGSTIEPDDELGLVYETNPSAGDLATGTITFTDQTPDSLRGATIYTAASQEGIQQANDRPPLAWDIEEFRGCSFFANTTNKHLKSFTLLGVGGTTGIQLNDTITIAGVTYTCKAAETVSSGEFKQFTGGTASQNIFDTAASLIRVINRYASNTLVYATYLSSPGDLPGQILIEERGVGGASFALTASNGAVFDPVLPTSGTTVASTNDAFANAIMFSKNGKQEAVPRANIKRIGSANNKILRIKKLKNTLFVLKQREGIFRITGTDPTNFDWELFDSSARLIAPDSVAVVNNMIWCLSDQGIITISETGVSVVSRPIEDLILDQYGLALNQVSYYSFGVGYETERQYQLWTVSSSGDTVATQGFIFNTFTQAYTRYPMSKSCGAVSPVDGKLYLGDGGTFYVERERKNRNYTDYVDYGVAYTISSSSGYTVYLTTTNEIAVGDLLYQSASVQSLITDVQPAYVTVQDSITWANGAATVYKSFECQVEYAAVTGGNPGMSKHFPEITMLFRAARFNTATLSFATDASGYFEDVPIKGNRTGLWGLFPWGTAAWGGTATSVPIRTLVPLEKERGSLIRVRFTHKQGYGYFKLNGWSMPFRETGSTAVAL